MIFLHSRLTVLVSAGMLVEAFDLSRYFNNNQKLMSYQSNGVALRQVPCNKSIPEVTSMKFENIEKTLATNNRP